MLDINNLGHFYFAPVSKGLHVPQTMGVTTISRIDPRSLGQV